MEEISSKYKIRPNVHVYTNLILACASNRSLQGGRLDDAAGLLRAALGLPEPIAILSSLHATSVHLDSNFVNEIIWDLAGHGRGQDLAALLISDIQKHNPRIRIHADTYGRVASPGAQATRLGPAFGCAASYSSSQGKRRAGKGHAEATSYPRHSRAGR